MSEEQLAAALRRIGEGLATVGEGIELAARALERGPEPEPTTGKRLKGESLRRAFRDWAVATSLREFEREDVAAGLNINPNTAARLIKWGLERGLLKRAGERAAAGSRGGRPARLYSYLPPDPTKNPRERPRSGDHVTSGDSAPKTAGPGKRRGGGRSREVRDIVDTLQRDRWRVVTANSGHLKVYNPDGALVTTLPSTPSDHRALRNARANAAAGRGQGLI